MHIDNEIVIYIQHGIGCQWLNVFGEKIMSKCWQWGMWIYSGLYLQY